MQLRCYEEFQIKEERRTKFDLEVADIRMDWQPLGICGTSAFKSSSQR
jgi:hypothetical protein